MQRRLAAPLNPSHPPAWATASSSRGATAASRGGGATTPCRRGAHDSWDGFGYVSQVLSWTAVRHGRADFARTFACGTHSTAWLAQSVAAEPAALEHMPGRQVDALCALQVAVRATLREAVGDFPVESGYLSRVVAARLAFDHGDGLGGCRGIVDCGLRYENGNGVWTRRVRCSQVAVCGREREYACVLRKCDGKVSLVVGAIESGENKDETVCYEVRVDLLIERTEGVVGQKLVASFSPPNVQVAVGLVLWPLLAARR